MFSLASPPLEGEVPPQSTLVTQTLFDRVYHTPNINFRQLPAHQETKPKASATKKKASTKKKAAEVVVKTPEAELDVIFVDVTDGKEEAKKESYINDVEAQALVEYYIENIQENSEFIQEISAARAEGAFDPSLLIISPYRT